MAAECDVLSEIEVLQSIYLDELVVDRSQDGGWEVSLVLHPSTAEDSVSQFVRLTLTLALDQQYPLTSPRISIRNPRGLSDDKLSSVQKCLQSEAQSCLGSPVLYQLIEKAKEILTESNIPHGSCAICLYDFQEGEAFTKTSCYHYFHCHCLGRYASHSESELRRREKELEEDKTRTGTGTALQELTVVCPVCREPLTYDVDRLLAAPPPQPPEVDEAAIRSSFRQRWSELQALLERQRSKGGIIDPEAESNRFLIHVHETVAENGTPDVEGSPLPTGPSVPQADVAGVRGDQPAPGLSHGRDGQAHRHQNPARGHRRGGRARPQPRRGPTPITDRLNKLRLSSDAEDQPEKAKAQGSRVQPMQVDAGLCPWRPEEGLSAEPREGPAAAPDTRPGFPAASEGRCPGGAADSRGHRQRRRGSHRPVPNSGASGAPHHWDAKGSRNRGGGGGGGGGGHCRGHSRGFQHKVADRERGREEVL